VLAASTVPGGDPARAVADVDTSISDQLEDDLAKMR
jgi:hypothetical protein